MLQKSKYDLKELEIARNQWVFHEFSAEWTQVSDRVIKAIFNRVNSTSSSVVLKQLIFEAGSLTSDLEEMWDIAT